MPRKQRRDAAENRERLIVAAFDVLTERGPDLTVRELALRTGLGIGTAYRHFPTHEDLIRALYDRAIAQVTTTLAEDLPEASAWERLCAHLEAVTFAVAEVPAVRTVMRRMHDIDPTSTPGDAATGDLQGLVDAAHAEGTIRSGITGRDLALTAFALAGMVGRPTERERTMLRRHLAIFLDGLRADGTASALPTEAMTSAQFRAFVHRSNSPAREIDAGERA
ncbi:TetR/AcrR family transcriptional regulator [Demequina sp. SO4-13]|uniref:TetR/AcrR family transcriptional regulator n=1 Tax=Demequina sp. SO4-13 TaxID=3401027 RepID=UPI003AF448CC